MKNYPTMKDVNRKVVITVDKNETLARIYEDNKVVAKGVAICSPDDTFDFKTGSELALSRAMEAMKPKQEWVVVNRKPRKGDYVRIVHPCFSFDKKGDVLKVDSLVNEDGFMVKTVDHPACNYYPAAFSLDEWCYLNSYVEVVVPAPKKPEFRKVNRDPKPGDYLRIITPEYPRDKQGDIYKISCREGRFIGVKHCDHPGHQELFKNDPYITDNYIWWYTATGGEILEKL